MAGKIPPQFLKNIKAKKGKGEDEDMPTKEHEAMRKEMHGGKGKGAMKGGKGKGC